MKAKLFLLTLLLAVFGSGYLLHHFVGEEREQSASAFFSSEKHPLINETVTANLGKHFIINFKPLRDELAELQKKYPEKTYIYFDYLNNASWLGLNEREEFTAASTIKVPIAMATMKAVEEGKLNLSDSYSLQELDLNDQFGDLYKVGTDKEFTIQELIEIMLKHSDNTAINALYHVFQLIGVEDPLGQVYGFLGWEFTQMIPAVGEAPNYAKINLKTLSNLFVALYNAKYVSIEHSEQILEYLAGTPFNDKIVAGVPEGIVVAHKIGTAADDDTFSDCGIVYAPNRHYLLCFGSNGADEKTAASFMAEASKAVYDYVIHN